MKYYTNFLFRYKWLNLVILALVILSSLSGLESLKTNYHMRYWLDRDDTLIKTLNYFEDNFGNDEVVVISLFDEEGILNQLTLELMTQLSGEVVKIKDVKSTQSLVNLEIPFWDQKKNSLESINIVDSDFNIDQIINRINSTKLIENFFITTDKKMTLILVELKPTIINEGEVFQEIDYRSLTGQLRELIKKYQTPKLKIHLSGTPILQNDFSAISEKDLALIMPILFLFICVVLYLLFRSILIVVISVVVISLTNTFVYGMAGYLGFEIENMLAIVPLIVLTISLADIVHIFVSYRAKRIDGISQIDAIISSIQDNFIPTFLTSFTTAIGFISLAGSKLIPVSNMGILAAIGVMMAWILSISLFPIFLSFIKDRRHYDVQTKMKLSFVVNYDFLKRHAALLMIVFISISSFLGYLGTKNIVNTDPLKFFKIGSEIRKSSDFILSKFGAVTGPELIIHSGFREGILEPEFLKKVDQFGSWLKEHNYINKTISIVELGKELYQKLNNDDPLFYRIPDQKDEIIDLYFKHKDKLKNTMKLNSRISSDMESMRLSLLWSISETRVSLDRLRAIENKAKEMGLTIRITGKNTLYLKMNDYVVETFFTSILYSIIAISLLMLILFKSIPFAIISMLPNLIPLGFITGIMTLTGIHIDIGTALVCSVCLGIAIDDTIHFLIQYHREKKNHQTDQAIINVLNKTGSALQVTSFILVVGFGLFMLSDFVPNIKFGFLCSVTITVALVTDLVLLPAILSKFDK